MAEQEIREELAKVAASLRAYLEWQTETGALGVPRRPREAKAEPAGAEANVGAAGVGAGAEANVGAAGAGARAVANAGARAFVNAGAEAPNARAEAEAFGINRPAELPPPRVAAPPKVAAAKRAEPAPPPRTLEVLQEQVVACTRCELHATRNLTVFARGNPSASLCFVGEAPGADEDAEGLPFVGRAGQLLDRMIGAMGLDPTRDVYVCNIIKCRPPGNRKPEPEETATCIPYLHEQLANVKPKVIVALGNTAASGLLGTKLGITKVRGQWKLYKGTIPVMPTYHPSYLLRPSATLAESKRQAWEDLQAVMKELGLSAPPKQS